jgi:hypothetical protein
MGKVYANGRKTSLYAEETSAHSRNTRHRYTQAMQYRAPHYRNRRTEQ